MKCASVIYYLKEKTQNRPLSFYKKELAKNLIFHTISFFYYAPML